MKELFEQVIQRREYDLKSLLTCIDQYHIEGKLTDDERQELTQAAREGATADYDYAGEINALWAAVRALQQSIRCPRCPALHCVLTDMWACTSAAATRWRSADSTTAA